MFLVQEIKSYLRFTIMLMAHSNLGQPRDVSRSLRIAFRVECLDDGQVETSNLNRPRDIQPRGEILLDNRRAWQKAFDAHLSADRQRGPTPFISFVTTWSAAMSWRMRLSQRSAHKIVIMAVWLKNKPYIYDALEIAKQLGYGQHPGDAQRQLNHHTDEVLLHGSIAANERRVLLCLRANGSAVESVFFRPDPLGLPSFRLASQLPYGAIKLPAKCRGDGTEAFRDYMFSLTGTVRRFEFALLLVIMAGRSYLVTEDEDKTALQVQMPGRSAIHLEFPNNLTAENGNGFGDCGDLVVG
ncbi:hypothetical protein HIM_05308 [Hirsutella minnesotensis 3608]|uniref:DUF7587 domain-containing protein n=1 Tax=Hirsutella minnesotensis 3608 TaxID=1043627 RepID=A0A0F8A0J2_9HYPO|nr:hypothetical protein HIM_05308 [Hirsutella minnesotensis 3608]